MSGARYHSPVPENLIQFLIIAFFYVSHELVSNVAFSIALFLSTEKTRATKKTQPEYLLYNPISRGRGIVYTTFSLILRIDFSLLNQEGKGGSDLKEGTDIRKVIYKRENIVIQVETHT